MSSNKCDKCRKKESENFWKDVKRMSDEYRKIPEDLRRLAGVSTQPFNPPTKKRKCKS